MIYAALIWQDNPGLGPEGWIGYAKLMLVLGAILIAAFVTVRFCLPKLTGPANSSSKRIRVLARFSLDPRKTLYVVAVGKTFVLIASSEAGLQLMTRLDPSDWNEDPSSNGEGGPATSNFTQLIGSIRTGRKN